MEAKARTVQDVSRTGIKPRRAPSRPFSEVEERHIRAMVREESMDDLYGLLADLQAWPRHQRMVQEAIERKRRSL